MSPYLRLATMVAVSTVAMFGLMYLDTHELDHVFFSETRAFHGAYPDEAASSGLISPPQSCRAASSRPGEWVAAKLSCSS